MKFFYKFTDLLTIFSKSNFLCKMSHYSLPNSYGVNKHILSQNNPNLTFSFLTARCRGIKFQVLSTPVQSESDRKEYK